VTESRIKLKRAIFRLALGMLLLILLGLGVPSAAGTAVLPGSFTVQVVISKIAVSGIGVSFATINWETNGNATSRVFYDTQMRINSDDYAYQIGDDVNLVVQHSIILTGLAQSTTYHYRIKSTAKINDTDLAVVSDDYTFSTGAISGGGEYIGSGAIGTLKLEEATGITVSAIGINSAGIAQNSGEITTKDGVLTITVEAGTRLLDSQGKPLTLITSTILTLPISPPEQRAIILVYDLIPNGATFTPPITLTLHYQPAILPQGVPENTLYIAFWNGSAWQALPSAVNVQARTVSAALTHFTFFALIGTVTPASTPTPIPTPTSTITPTPSTSPTPEASPTPSSVATPTPVLTPSLPSTPTPTATLSPTATTPTPEPTPSMDLVGILTKWWLMTIIFVAVILVILIVLFAVRRKN
jgi:hypothetical protein